MEQRIKLVFVDEIARFVARRRGFCACWYLVPRGAKLVGDLAYAIMAEFELLGACPSGVELALQELPLLPNQDARIVRDNDEIHVHCASSGMVSPYSTSSSVSSARSMSLFSGGKQRDVAMLFGSSRDDESAEDAELDKHDRKRRKRQLREMQQQAQEAAIEEKKRRKESKKKKKEEMQAKSQRQKAKAAETLAVKANKESSSNSSNNSSDSEEDDDDEWKEKRQKPQKSLATKRKAIGDKARSSKSDSSSSSDDSSSSSSSSSDSESDSEKPTEPERKRFRTSQSPAPTLPTRPAVNSKSAVSLAKPQTAAEPEGKQRRRRRPRHRKLRDAPATTADNGTEVTAVRQSALSSTPKAKSVDSQTVRARPPPAAAVVPPQSHSLATSSGGDSSITTTAPIVKGHVRFGDAGESQFVARPEKTLNVRKPRSAYVPQELHKYGPRPGAATERPRRNQSQRHAQTANGNPAAAASSKKKAGEVWKRPYEIVASIHDTPIDTAAAPSIDISSLLAKFPPPPSSIAISTESVAESDVIAYKTLTLCMETWQPLLSAWLCGHVTSVTPSEGTIYVTPMALSINDQQLQWKESTQVEEEVVVVQVSELSELRYLDGPSFQAMKEFQNQQQP